MTVQLFNFDSSNILTIGSTCIDTYWHGNVERISPEAPVPVTHYKNSEHRLAGAGLISSIVKKLSRVRNTCNSSLISICGAQDTKLNKLLSDLLNRNNIENTDYNILNIANQTAEQIRIVSRSQQLLGVDKTRQSIVDSDDLDKLNEIITKEVIKNKLVILYDDGSNLLNNKYTIKWLQLCNENNIKVIYCAKNQETSQKFVNKYCIDSDCRIDYIILTKPVRIHTDDINNNGLNLSKINSSIIILDEEQSALKFHTDNNTSITIKESLLEVENKIGVLESVAAVLALGIANNIDLEQILRMAVSAVSIVSRNYGQVIFDTVDLELAYADNIMEYKYNYLKLAQEIQVCRDKGQKIIFANGCFDVMHIGHFSYLKAAKQRGDKLFVAINSDDSIKRLKGDSRPVNCLEDRVFLLSQLDFVDWVVPFFTDTPCDFISWLQPDILVKGGDYDINGVIGKEIVDAYGGKVEIIKHDHTDMSSTKIIENNTSDV